MQRLRQYRIALSRKTETGAALEALVEALRSAGALDGARIRFFLQNRPVGGRDASRSLIRAYPAFETYLYRPGPPVDAPAVSDFDGSWVGGNPSLKASEPMDVDLLLEVARGIPRRFPFQFATFLAEPVPPLGTIEPDSGRRSFRVGAPSYASPNLLVASHWWVTGRKVEVRATALRTPGTAAEAPSAEAIAFMRGIGEPEPIGWIYRFSEDEQRGIDAARQQADQLVNAFADRIADIAVRLPHPLDAMAERESANRLRVFRDVTGTEGWEVGAQPGRGIYKAARRDAWGHDLEIYIDVNDFAGSAIAFASLSGPGWHYSIRMPLAKDGAIEVAAGGDGRWRCIVENLCAGAQLVGLELFDAVSALFAARRSISEPIGR